MEPSYQTRKIIGQILAIVCLLGLAGAFWAQLSSPVLQRLSKRENTPVRIAVFTKPPMRFSYNPTEKKAHVTIGVAPCDSDKPSACFNGEFDFFCSYIIRET